MCQVAFEIPDEVLYDSKMSRRDAPDFARRATTLHFYATKGVSLGYCAQIAGMGKEDFIYFLGRNGASVFRFDDEAEFVEETSNAYGGCQRNPAHRLRKGGPARHLASALWRAAHAGGGSVLSKVRACAHPCARGVVDTSLADRRCGAKTHVQCPSPHHTEARKTSGNREKMLGIKRGMLTHEHVYLTVDNGELEELV